MNLILRNCFKQRNETGYSSSVNEENRSRRTDYVMRHRGVIDEEHLANLLIPSNPPNNMDSFPEDVASHGSDFASSAPEMKIRPRNTAIESAERVNEEEFLTFAEVTTGTVEVPSNEPERPSSYLQGANQDKTLSEWQSIRNTFDPGHVFSSNHP